MPVPEYLHQKLFPTLTIHPRWASPGFHSCWMSIKPPAQFCGNCPTAQAAVCCHGEEQGWYPLVWCCTRQPRQREICANSLAQVLGPRATTLSPFIYLFHYFFMSILTYLRKRRKNKRKGFFQQQVCGEQPHLIPQGCGRSCLYSGGSSSSVWEVDDGWRCATLSGRCNEHHHLPLTRDHSKLGFNFQLQCDPPCSY